MPLVDTGDIVQRARSDRRAALAFNVIQLEHAEALCAAAERAGTGVVLQLSENTARYHRSLAPIAECSARPRLGSAGTGRGASGPLHGP